jgi:hypothetical protein
LRIALVDFDDDDNDEDDDKSIGCVTGVVDDEDETCVV